VKPPRPPSPAPRKYAAKVRGRPFAKGNPGKPRGAKNKTTLASEDLLEGAANRITQKAIQLAEAGDPAAIKLCMDRYHPVRKARVKFEMRPIANEADVVAAMADVAAAVASKVLTLDEAASTCTIIEKVRDAIRNYNTKQALEALERMVRHDQRQ
jgi:hypothetical protein